MSHYRRTFPSAATKQTSPSAVAKQTPPVAASPRTTASPSASPMSPSIRLSASQLANHFDDLDLLEGQGQGTKSFASSSSRRGSLTFDSNGISPFSSQSSLGAAGSSVTSSSGASTSTSCPSTSSANATYDDFVIGSWKTSPSFSVGTPGSVNQQGHGSHGSAHHRPVHAHPHNRGSRRASHPNCSSPATAAANMSSKERYVFSNFRFLIRAAASPTVGVDDALDWLKIEAVIVPEIEPVLCPICLDVPLCPRFTRCGHIYCFPCILQFFRTSDTTAAVGSPSAGAQSSLLQSSNWRACPVCAEAVHLKQLRPVTFWPVSEPRIGDILNTVLLHRESGSMTPEEVNSEHVTDSRHHPDLQISPFARLTPISPHALLQCILRPESLDLREEIAKRRVDESASGLGESLEFSFLIAAADSLSARIIEVEKAQFFGENGGGEAKDEEVRLPGEKLTKRKDPQTARDISSSSNGNTAPGESPASFYFHQAQDGLNVFLHPLNMKILRAEYGDYAHIPSHLSLPVLHCERMIMEGDGNHSAFHSHGSPDPRRRFKYLDHLPAGSQIILVEADLSSVVSPETLALHQRELSERAANRAHKKWNSKAAAAASSSASPSLLEEWKRMEDDYYSTLNAALPIPPPEIVNLDDLHDEASFPLIETQPSRATRIPRLAAVNSSFADAAASPPSHLSATSAISFFMAAKNDEAAWPSLPKGG